MKVKSCYMSALFVILFSFYAISPLSCTFSDDGIVKNSIIPYSAPSFSGNVRIFFWELICSKLVSVKDCARTASTDRILISKVRAVVSGNPISEVTHSEYSLIPEGISYQASLLAEIIFFALETTKPPESVFLLYSGLSPPLV